MLQIKSSNFFLTSSTLENEDATPLVWMDKRIAWVKSVHTCNWLPIPSIQSLLNKNWRTRGATGFHFFQVTESPLDQFRRRRIDNPAGTGKTAYHLRSLANTGCVQVMTKNFFFAVICMQDIHLRAA